MEPANATTEEKEFAHVAETRQFDAQHVRTGSYVARLSAAGGRREGSSITRSVQARRQPASRSVHPPAARRCLGSRRAAGPLWQAQWPAGAPAYRTNTAAHCSIPLLFYILFSRRNLSMPMKISTLSAIATRRCLPPRSGVIALAGALTLFAGSASAQFHVNIKNKAPYPKDKIGKIAKEVRADGWILFKETLKDKPQDIAGRYKASLGLGPADELRATESLVDELGITRYRYTQYHGAWPVQGADFSIYGKAEKPLFASGRLVHVLTAPQAPAVTEKQALATALASVPARRYQWQDLQQEQDLRISQQNPAATNYPKGEVLYALTADDGNATGTVHRLAYRYDIMRIDPQAYEAVYIDALTGGLLRIASLVSNGSCQNNQVDT